MSAPDTMRAADAGRRRLLGALAFVLVLAAAVAVAWWATRDARGGAGAGGAAAGGHDHAAMLAAGGGGGDAPRAVRIDAADARRIGVTYAVATTDPAARELRVVGEVAVDETRQHVVALKVDGWVERLHVDFTGRAVRAGEPMLALYAPMLVSTQEELLLARRHAAALAGTADPEAARAARELVESARRRLRLWDVPAAEIARVERTGVVRRTITVAAPASGVVVEKSVVAGQQVAAGQPLFRLADLGRVWIEGEVYEQDLPAVRVGQGVDVELRALPGQTRRGRVEYVYPTLDPATRTARVRVAVPNDDRRLLPGMYATLRLRTPGRADVVTVPRGAVLSTGERHMVFVKRPDGRLAPHLVLLGAAGEERVEVLLGIAAGDTVVASATFLLDAESNLGSAMGGMGDHAGMDMTAPVPLDAPRGAPPPAGAPSRAAPGARPAAPHGGH